MQLRALKNHLQRRSNHATLHRDNAGDIDAIVPKYANAFFNFDSDRIRLDARLHVEGFCRNSLQIRKVLHDGYVRAGGTQHDFRAILTSRSDRAVSRYSVFANDGVDIVGLPERTRLLKIAVYREGL